MVRGGWSRSKRKALRCTMRARCPQYGVCVTENISNARRFPSEAEALDAVSRYGASLRRVCLVQVTELSPGGQC